jgi:hypothetical protein
MRGSCLCGSVTYEVSGPLRPSVACHCTQCRKTSGHYWSATQAAPGALAIHDSGSLRWFRSSDKAERGFCAICGSSLFWRHDDDGGVVPIGSGTLDGPTGITTVKHIYTADKGDYYDIADTVPQQED